MAKKKQQIKNKKLTHKSEANVVELVKRVAFAFTADLYARPDDALHRMSKAKD